MRRGGPALCALLLLLGCGAGLAERAAWQARQDLHCAPSGLHVRQVGTLVAGTGRGQGGVGPLAVAVYDAEGCDAAQRYLCTSTPKTSCTAELGALPRPETHAALKRALDVLRIAARARCPGSTLRVTQESETLFRYEACDGSATYHCRKRGCERL